MAIAASQTARPRFAGRLILLALMLSLVVNICVVAGVVWSRLHAAAGEVNPSDRFMAMASQLKLTPEQRVAFERYFRTMRARTQLMHEEVEPLIADAWAEIGKPQADEAQVMRLFDQAAEKRRSFQREVTTQTVAFLATLTPEQRAKFVELARDRHTAWTRRIHDGLTP